MPTLTTSPPTAALSVHELSKNFGSTTAVDNISFTAQRGDITAVLGPNGAGKSTTINCCVGLLRPQSGRIQTLGFDPGVATAHDRARVGVMLQDGGLTSGARAGQLLRHTASLFKNPVPPADLAEQLGINAFARTLVRRLSGGQRQRLGLALALVGRPELVFLDEPTAGMDPQSRVVVWELIRDLQAAGTSFVLTTHLLDEAEKLSNHVVIIDHGRVLAAGSVAELVGAGTAASPTRLTLRSSEKLPEYMLENIPGITAVHDSGHHQVELEGTITPGVIRSLAGLAAQRNVLLHEISTGAPSLEDTYLNLTGRSLR